MAPYWRQNQEADLHGCGARPDRLFPEVGTGTAHSKDEHTEASARRISALATANGLTETALKRMTNLSTSLFHEVMLDLLGEGRVVLSRGDGHKIQTEYHLVRVDEQLGPLEGPVTPLAAQVLARLGNRAEGARTLAKALDLEVSTVQVALDGLEAFQLVKRTQIEMLVIYRSTTSGLSGRR